MNLFFLKTELMSETFSKKKIYKNLENALEKLLKINFFALHRKLIFHLIEKNDHSSYFCVKKLSFIDKLKIFLNSILILHAFALTIH